MSAAVAVGERKAAASQWFESLRDQICAAFEAIEDEHAGAPDLVRPVAEVVQRALGCDVRDLRRGLGGRAFGQRELDRVQGIEHRLVAQGRAAARGEFRDDVAQQRRDCRSVQRVDAGGRLGRGHQRDCEQRAEA